MERCYEIAGVRLRVVVPERWLSSEEGLLERFSVAGGYDRTLEFLVTDRLDGPAGTLVYQDGGKQIFRLGAEQIRYEGNVAQGLDGAYLRIHRRGDYSLVQVLSSAIPYGITSKLIQTAMEAEHMVVGSGGFLLHASIVEYQGKAILFTAPCGTGKSTQAALWHRLRSAQILNGDRAAVRGGTVWSTPFCGSSGLALHRNLPIAAIVYLSQAPSTEIHRLSGSAAFRRIWEGCSVNVWDDEDMERCTDAVSRTVLSVPMYHLACTPDESAVIAVEREVFP